MPNRRPGIDSQLRLEWNDLPVLINVFPLMAERNQPKGTAAGRNRQRARANAVEELIRGAER
jgi:hypothetical protein